MKNVAFILCFVTFLIFGCASSYLKNASNIGGEKKTYDKILIVAKAKDKLARIKFENQVVKDFAQSGINAQSSIEIIKPESFEKKLTDNDIENIKQKLIENDYDGIIITNLINVNEYTDVVSRNTGTAFVPVRYGRFGRYYGAYPVSYWEADEIKTGIEYTLESCLYDITTDQNDNLQWVGRFKVKDPNSLIKTIEKYAKELTEALLNTNISQP